MRCAVLIAEYQLALADAPSTPILMNMNFLATRNCLWCLSTLCAAVVWAHLPLTSTACAEIGGACVSSPYHSNGTVFVPQSCRPSEARAQQVLTLACRYIQYMSSDSSGPGAASFPVRAIRNALQQMGLIYCPSRPLSASEHHCWRSPQRSQRMALSSMTIRGGSILSV